MQKRSNSQPKNAMQQLHSLETQFKNQFAQAAIDQLDNDYEILQNYI